MDLITEIKLNYIYTNHAVRRIIAINVLVFVALGIFNLMLTLFQIPLNTDQLMNLFMLPAYLPNLIKQPWSMLTSMFLHSGLLHLVFNMIWLYWMGNLLHEYLGNSRVYQAYFLGGIFGGITYIIAYNIFPYFSVAKTGAYAIGASAGVLSVMVASATLLPNFEIRLFLLGNIRLKWLALVIMVIDLLSITSGNAGGHIAHLGGAVFGFLFIKYLYKHTFLESIFEKIGDLFKRKSKLRVHYKTNQFKPDNNTKPSEDEVNLILDKINRSGYDSLSKSEKEKLFKASND